jgi:hypothetical protein
MSLAIRAVRYQFMETFYKDFSCAQSIDSSAGKLPNDFEYLDSGQRLLDLVVYGSTTNQRQGQWNLK